MERFFYLLCSYTLGFPLYILFLFAILFLIHGIRTLFIRLITASRNLTTRQEMPSYSRRTYFSRDMIMDNAMQVFKELRAEPYSLLDTSTMGIFTL